MIQIKIIIRTLDEEEFPLKVDSEMNSGALKEYIAITLKRQFDERSYGSRMLYAGVDMQDGYLII